MGDLDPFEAPPPSHRVADAPMRTRVVLDGVVLDVHRASWVGGPVMEVTITDGTGVVCLAFLGSRGIAGVEPRRALTVAGTLGSRQGRSVLMNPVYWLHAPVSEVGDA